MSMQVTSAYAKANFPELLKAVEGGETVQITRYNKLVASLVPYTASQGMQPRLGTAPSSVRIVDPNWAESLTWQQMESLIETGSY
jgi:antitoxin (DNA-binding transcriptional repressor) of toxin-antitoxin stability system